jgi:hypothetical protein
MTKRTITRIEFIAVILISLTIGGLAGFFVAKDHYEVIPLRTISVIITDGKETRYWTGIDVAEGQSIADTIAHIDSIEPIGLTFTGEGREREINSLLAHIEGASGNWKYYLDGQSPQFPIARYFPKGGENITIIWSAR